MVYLGADHGGFELKEKIKTWLKDAHIEFTDCGALQFDPSDDYPDFAFAVAKKVLEDVGSMGILLCRSGGGMVIAANRMKGIRAVEIFDHKSAVHAREHNNANIASISADWIEITTVFDTLSTFLNTPFTNEKRHVQRLEKIEKIV